MSSPSAREPIDGAMDRRDIARARRQAGVLVRQLRPVAGLSCERFDVPEVANIGPGHPSLYRTSIQSQNSTYTGETLFGRAHGRGETLWNEGTRHTGTYVAGSRHGYGTQHFASGATYRGMFTDGERTGSGTHAYANGAQFVGDFLRGQRHGDGVYIDSSGDRFERAYVHDRPQTPEWATGPAPHTQSRNDRRPNPSVVQTQTNARAQMRTYSFSIGPIRTIRVAAQGIPLLVGGVGHNVLAPR